VIVAGASDAIFTALAGLVERGRPVVVELPAYAAMERCVQMLGGAPVHVERLEADGWRLDPERLDACLAESGARLVGITDPHNPTGVSLDATTRAAIVEVIERHGAVLVVDEIFAPFRGPRRPPAWAASSDRVLTLGSLTKGWGLSALRTGWVLGAPALVARSRQVFDLLGVNPPTATLALAKAALEHAPTLDDRAHRASCRVNDIFAATDWGDASMAPPQDGIIGFLRLPPGCTSEAAVSALREKDGVQAVPGHFFGHDTHLRIGFDPATIDGAAGCRLISVRVNGQSGASA
jgi:aspartate/methionine/tyrosine aminotransferase